MINIIIQLAFILFLLGILIFYGLIIYAARRAAKQTTIPIPIMWERVMMVTFFIILISIAFVLFIRP